MTSLSIRPAAAGDLPSIVAIYNEAVAEQATAHTEPVTAADWHDWLPSHPVDRRPAYVACEGDAVLGWASLSDYRCGRQALENCAELSYYVAGDARRRGVATRLIEHIFAQAPSLNIDTVFGIVLDDNEASLSLLTRLGFSRWGHLPDIARFGERRVGHVYMGRKVDAASGR